MAKRKPEQDNVIGMQEYQASLTPEQRSENARKGAEGKKEKKTLRELTAILMDGIAPAEAQATMAALGLTKEQMTNKMLLVVSLFRLAVDGDMKAIEKIEDYIGEKVADQEQANGMLAVLIKGLVKHDDE